MYLTTPVAFFIFNRPDLTEIVFNAIAEAHPKKLLVIADGPRSPEEAQKCQQARAVIEKVDWDCEVITNFADRNLGCKQRVSSGISWVFSLVDKAIFLEDDCLPDPSFFSFCHELLETYQDDQRVMHISGGNFLYGHIAIEDSYYFSRYTFAGYGWASWRRAWQYYDPDMKSWADFKQNNLLETVFENPFEQVYWEHMLDRTFNQEIDTWDFQWFYTCWSQNGLAITPQVNLVSNLGFRPDATHTNSTDERSHLANIPRKKIDEIIHPKFILRHTAADRYTFETHVGRQDRNLKKRHFLVEKAIYYLTAAKWKLSQLGWREL